METQTYKVERTGRVQLKVYAPTSPKEATNYYKMPLEELRRRLNEEFEERPYGGRFKEMQSVYSRRLTIGR